MPGRLVLDAGPVIAVARGDKRVAAQIAQADADGMTIVVPPAVVTQVLRGGGRDTPVHMLLASCVVPPVGRELARLAGELLGRTGSSDVADAQLVAEALSDTPCVILTGDPDDIRALVAGHAHVTVVTLSR